jgi:hypothetical protein
VLQNQFSAALFEFLSNPEFAQNCAGFAGVERSGAYYATLGHQPAPGWRFEKCAQISRSHRVDDAKYTIAKSQNAAGRISEGKCGLLRR